MSWAREARGLYAIVDPALSGRWAPLELAEAILSGGCAVLQYRDKGRDDRARLGLARELRRLTARFGVPFVINDRADLALLCAADGLHLGQDDLPIAEARRVVGRMIIGRSTHDEAQVARASAEDHDLLGFGPVFATSSKESPDPVQGVEGLVRARELAAKPLVAIGGIDLAGAARVAAAGVPLAAVISALARADDPEAAARALHETLASAPAASS
jgi:thiamine-phosphate pyrophosphorylase